MADRHIKVSEELFSKLTEEIQVYNDIAERIYIDQCRKFDLNQRRKLKKPIKITIKEYTELALNYFLKNHVDPRTLGQEQDVITEVRKLRNNVFSFMQVQERTYLAPFSEDVYKLDNRMNVVEETSFDMLNLMEIFIDLQLTALGLNAQEQEDYRQKAAQLFQQKKAARQANRG